MPKPMKLTPYLFPKRVFISILAVLLVILEPIRPALSDDQPYQKSANPFERNDLVSLGVADMQNRPATDDYRVSGGQVLPDHRDSLLITTWTPLQPELLVRIELPIDIISIGDESHAALDIARKLFKFPIKRARFAAWNVNPNTLVHNLAADPERILRLSLFEDADYTVSRLQLVRFADLGVSISGRLDKEGGGSMHLSVAQGIATALISAPASDYRIFLNPRSSESPLLIVEIDKNAYPPESDPENFDEEEPADEAHSRWPSIRNMTPPEQLRLARESTESTVLTGDNSILPPKDLRPQSLTTEVRRSSLSATPVHDLLVVYTDDVLSTLGGMAAVTTTITSATSLANSAYENSGISQRLNLAGTMLVDYDESGDYGTELSRLQHTNDGWIDAVHARRDRLGADLVAMLVAQGEKCGKANLAVISSDADDDSAFAIVRHDCITGHTFTHELAHIAGAHHDWQADPFPLPRYAHGFVSTRGAWRTIMGYDNACDDENISCPRVNFFSNPDQSFTDGLQMGDHEDGDNRRRLNETATTLESFRISGPRISLYEGNNGSQDHVCVYPVAVDSEVSFQSDVNFRFCDNDEARSGKLFDVPAGRVIRLLDHPDGKREDDWAEIIVKRNVAEKLIPTFQRPFEDADVRLIHHRNNGLDGKVSRIEVSSARTGPVIDLYEGNNATQNLVCSVVLGGNFGLEFNNHRECENDEARSAVIYDMPAGWTVRLFDHPGGSRSDDWVEMVSRRPFKRKVIGSFQRHSEGPELSVRPFPHNGLDGKVSRLEVRASKPAPRIFLYEGNNASQDLICELQIGNGQTYNLRSIGHCANDEARSAVLYDIPAGEVVLLYDSPRGSREDDWTGIVTKRFIGRKEIGSFERTIEDLDLRMVNLHNNGLDGKVSRVASRRMDAQGGVISFYEGNNASQNKVCDLTLRDLVLNFKNHGACDNDEARSAVMIFAKAGTAIRIYDDPDCETSDDWTEIIVKRDLFSHRIGTFENSANNADYRASHHHHNGLDGKVSCVRIGVP